MSEFDWQPVEDAIYYKHQSKMNQLLEIVVIACNTETRSKGVLTLRYYSRSDLVLQRMRLYGQCVWISDFAIQFVQIKWRYTLLFYIYI